MVPAVRWAGWATGASRGLLGKPCCVRGGALRGGVCRLVADGSEQFVAGGIDCAGGVEVALGIGDGIELLEGDAGFEERRGIGKGFELLIGGGDVLVAVAFFDFPFVVALFGGEQAGSMVVEERR